MLALAATAVLEAIFRPGLTAPILSAVVSAGLTGTLLIRRSSPLVAVLLAFGVCAAVSLVTDREYPEQHVLLYLLFLPFALVRWGSGRAAVIGAGAVTAKVGLAVALGYLRPADAVAGVVILFAAMATGAAVRYRHRARTRELDQVTLLERERLARDLHDTVAHHVSAMAIRAQAGIAIAPADPDAAVDALRLIEAEAARALDEMRGIVRILRAADEPDRTPGPCAGDIEALSSGGRPEVAVEVIGDAGRLPSPVGAALYRLAQEAVTNARRHARHATRVDVRVVVARSEVRLKVSDDGEPAAARPAGFGLTGMIERAALLGGTCQAGPNEGRGWTVTAVLPG